MKKKTLCILSGLLFLIIFSFPLLAQPLPVFPTPPPTPKITPTIPPRPIPSIPPGTIPSEPETTPTTPTLESLNCDGVPKIIIDIAGLPDSTTPEAEIQKPFTNYSLHLYDGAYKLCFDIRNGPASLTSPFIINALDKPLLVSGLHVARSTEPSVPKDFDLITIKGTSSRVVLIGESVIPGESIIRGETNIQGLGSLDEGACLVLQGSGHIVKNSKFHGCNEGIRIEGSGMRIGAPDETRFEAEKNEIYANNTGIHWVSGTGNKFAYNKIFMNPELADPASSDRAIQIDSVDIIRPDFAFKDEKAAADEKALHCTVNNEGAVTSLFFQFDPAVALTDNEMIIYASSLRYRQIEGYFSKCMIGENGKCPLTVLPSGYSSSYDAENKECVITPEIRVVALINGTDHTSMLTPQVPITRGPVVAIGIETGDLVDAIPAGSGATGERVGSESSGTTNEAKSSGGCGGGGGGMTIIPPGNRQNTVTSGLTMWWIIFTAPAILVAVRIKKKR